VVKSGIAATLLSLLVGCASSSGGQASITTLNDPASGTQEVTTSVDALTTVPEKATDAAPGSVATGDLPDELVSGLIAAAVERSGVAPGEVRIETAYAVAWPDTSLGCSRSGESYAQVMTDGYRVTVDVAGRLMDVRVSAAGDVVICEPSDERSAEDDRRSP
jgi:hypothetical protein